MGLKAEDLGPARPAPLDGICKVCSAQPYTRCDNCTHKFCVGHWERHTQAVCDSYRGENTDTEPATHEREVGRREDFFIVKTVTSHDCRYKVMAPDGANETGVTLGNLRALWHLLGEVIEGEEK